MFLYVPSEKPGRSVVRVNLHNDCEEIEGLWPVASLEELKSHLEGFPQGGWYRTGEQGYLKRVLVDDLPEGHSLLDLAPSYLLEEGSLLGLEDVAVEGQDLSVLYAIVVHQGSVQPQHLVSIRDLVDEA